MRISTRIARPETAARAVRRSLERKGWAVERGRGSSSASIYMVARRGMACVTVRVSDHMPARPEGGAKGECEFYGLSNSNYILVDGVWTHYTYRALEAILVAREREERLAARRDDDEWSGVEAERVCKIRSALREKSLEQLERVGAYSYSRAKRTCGVEYWGLVRAELKRRK